MLADQQDNIRDLLVIGYVIFFLVATRGRQGTKLKQQPVASRRAYGLIALGMNCPFECYKIAVIYVDMSLQSHTAQAEASDPQDSQNSLLSRS